MIERLRRFVASVYSWKLNLILERVYTMALQLDALSAQVDNAVQRLGAVAQLQADLKAAQDAVAAAQADTVAAQAKVDELTAKLAAATA
jgi:hypothetical protein